MTDHEHTNTGEETPLPMVAPCRTLRVSDPLRWVSAGWRDLRRAPGVSLALGFGIVALSWAISWLAWSLGSLPLLIGMMSAFILVGPLVAMGFYSVSARLERGERPTLERVWRNAQATASNVAIFGLVLLVVGLVWARAASMVHVFFPVSGEVGGLGVALFLAVGSLVGSIFCAVIFTASAFSLPMLKDRDTDAITAVLSSANAVLRNKGAMAVWAAIIVAGVAIGFATALLGLALTVPLLGHATWHGYRNTLDASRWPARNAASGRSP
jgi:uncharacterized membrane protein